MPPSSKLLSTCINAIDASICIIDQQGIIRLANTALASLCGLQPGSLEGKSYTTILPEDRESAARIEALIKGETDKLSEQKVGWDSSENSKYIKGYAIDDESPELGKCRVLFLSDISDEVKQRTQLEHQASILKSVQDSVIVTNMDGIVTYWNEAATRLFGYSEEELLGYPIDKFNPGFDPKAFLALSNGNKEYFERIDWKFVSPDGREIWADVKLSLLYDKSGDDAKGFIGVSKDITEKKLQEKELIHRTKELASLVESQTNFLVRANLKGNYTFANKHFLEHFGYDESLIGKHFSSQIHPDDIEKSREGIAKCVNNPGKAVAIELRKPKGDGTYFTNYWEFVGISNEEGVVTELQGIGYDITSRKEAENKVKYLNTFNELLLGISTDLINLNYRNLKERIVLALKDITDFTGFDQALMYLFNDEKSESFLQYEYSVEGIPPPPQETHRYPATPFNWWMEKILKLEVVEISDTQNLPVEAENIKKEMEAHGLRAIITVHVAYQQEGLGFVGFFSIKKDKNWDKDTISLLNLLGAIFANTLYRAQSDRALELSHNRYKLLADNIGDVILKHDLQYIIKFVTPSSQEMLGYSPEELFGESLAALVHSDDLMLIAEHVQQALAGEHIRFVTRLKKKNETYFWAEISAKALEDFGKTELIAVIRDIDTQKQIEIEKDELFRETHALNEELQASEEELLQTLDKTVELNDLLVNSERKFKGLIEKSFDGIVVYGPDSSIKYSSPSATQIIGYEPEELLQMTGRDLIHPEDLPQADQAMAGLIKQVGHRISFEVRSIRKDGKTIWLETHMTNLLEDPAIQGLVANFRDITDKKLANIELEESRTSLNVAQKVAKVGSWEFNLSDMKPYLSDELYAILGLEKEKVMSLPFNFIEYVHPEDQVRIQAIIDQVKKGQKIPDLEFKLIDKWGHLKYIRSSNRFLKNEQGERVKILGTMQDVTKEMELEKLLEETSKLAKVGGWEIDMVNNELTWTPETYRIHEIPVGQALTIEEAVQFYHPEDKPLLDNALQKMMTQGAAYDLEVRIITAKGKEKWIRATAGIVHKSGEKIIKFRGSFQDINERKLREEDIKRYSERLALATDSAQIGVWDLDIQKDILNWDKQTCLIFGIGGDKYQGTYEDLESRTHPDDLENLPKLVDLQQWKNNDIIVHFRIIIPDTQEVKYIQSSAKVIFDKHQKAVRMIGVHWDITSSKQYEESLRKNNEELRKTNEELDHFVYSTSHNLRAPLTSVMGIVDILREAESEEERNTFMDLIQKSIYKLDETIQEINDYSKNARVEVQTLSIDLKQVIENIAESLSFMQNAREMNLELSIPDGLDFYSDPGRIKIIFNNLLSNAVKYANPAQEAPFVSVTVEKRQKGIHIHIQDNGIGIKQEYLDKVFNMFFRATNKSSGSGLGLYIVKEAVEKLGGEISISSFPGVGTDFYIDLPNLK